MVALRKEIVRKVKKMYNTKKPTYTHDHQSLIRIFVAAMVQYLHRAICGSNVGDYLCAF